MNIERQNNEHCETPQSTRQPPLTRTPLDKPTTLEPAEFASRSTLPLPLTDWLLSAWSEHQRYCGGSLALVTLNLLSGDSPLVQSQTEGWLEAGMREFCHRINPKWRRPTFKYDRPIGFYVTESTADDQLHAHGVIWLPGSIAIRPEINHLVTACYKDRWPQARSRCKSTAVDVRTFLEENGLQAYLRKNWPKSSPEARVIGIFPAGRFLKDDYATVFSRVDEFAEASLQERRKANARAAKVGELLRDRRLTSEALTEILGRPSSSGSSLQASPPQKAVPPASGRARTGTRPAPAPR